MRGPLDILRESWTGCAEVEIPIATFVVEMRDRLEEMVQKNVKRAQLRQKSVYDRGTKQRNLEVGVTRNVSTVTRLTKSYTNNLALSYIAILAT